MNPKKSRVVICGLGPLGLLTVPFILERASLELVGAVDIDPQLAGRDVGELAGLGRVLGVKVRPDLEKTLRDTEAHVCILTTVSDLARLKPQLETAIRAGAYVVSTCEELSYPWTTAPDFCHQIDQLARENGVAVLGTGVNPGFLMDFLPQALTAVCRKVERVIVQRVQDASKRRIPFQKKIGAGLSLEEFAQKIKDGTLRHVGLTESLHMIASQFGWKLERTQDVIEPVVASERWVGETMTVQPGMALGVLQTGRGFRDGQEVITLVFRASVGEPDSYDRVLIEGEPRIDSTIKGGVHGDTATCAITVNAIRSIMKAAPGLHTMVDVPSVAWFEG
ncbi:dihydrodipicolinate reductase [bacterium]|nr:dihydrodipicolinate reductase [bacterium]